MSMKKIGVGIIGANPDRGWAFDAHIPALRALDGLDFVALSTSRRESALAASRKFGVALAYDHHEPLVKRPEVDLVVITVRVPHHLALVQSAIDAGKAVYCEWPLGNGLHEAESMAELARRRGIYGAVGLQARSAPVVAYVRDLVAQGYVGEVLSSTIVADAMNWGADVLDCYAYLLDRRNGASMLTIPFGHAVDALCWCLGEFAELSATCTTRRPKVKHIESGRMLDCNVADQVGVSGILENGAFVSVHFRGGLSRGTHFLWEINGTDGDLVVRADGGHIQMLPMTLHGARGTNRDLAAMPVPSRYDAIGGLLAGNPMAASVARVYQRLTEELSGKDRRLPSFEDAVVRHRMLDAIVTAAETGAKQSYKTTC